MYYRQFIHKIYKDGFVILKCGKSFFINKIHRSFGFDGFYTLKEAVLYHQNRYENEILIKSLIPLWQD
jgi:hypothetical protein